MLDSTSRHNPLLIQKVLFNVKLRCLGHHLRAWVQFARFDLDIIGYQLEMVCDSFPTCGPSRLLPMRIGAYEKNTTFWI